MAFETIFLSLDFYFLQLLTQHHFCSTPWFMVSFVVRVPVIFSCEDKEADFLEYDTFVLVIVLGDYANTQTTLLCFYTQYFLLFV